MTLILAAIRQRDILLTADSRATITSGGVSTFDDHYQKLFPIPDHPVAIAHLGENDFNGEPVDKWLAQFMKHLNAGNLTIQGIADELQTFLQPAVRNRLRELKDPADKCGFWVAGFSFYEDRPSIVEIMWSWAKEVFICEERRWYPTTTAKGGDGQNQIPPGDLKRISGKSREAVHAYHQSLMEQALNADVKSNSVGGRPHELLITAAEWKWTLPPPEHPVASERVSPTTQPTTGPTTHPSTRPDSVQSSGLNGEMSPRRLLPRPSHFPSTPFTRLPVSRSMRDGAPIAKPASA